MSFKSYPILLDEAEEAAILNYQAARDAVRKARINSKGEFTPELVAAMGAEKEARKSLKNVDLVGLVAGKIREFHYLREVAA